MKIETKAVHAGDRKIGSEPAGRVRAGHHAHFCGASTYLYENTAQLDRVLGREEPGYCYSRYDNPTNAALEELVTELEGGAGALACSSGMAALHVALLAALVDRRKSILAADALYGATTSLLTRCSSRLAWRSTLSNVCDLEAVESAIDAAQTRMRDDRNHVESAAAGRGDRPDRGDGASSRRGGGGG